MSKIKRPKLPLTQEEKRLLRTTKIKISDIHKYEVRDIINILKVSKERAELLIGLATFQQIPSIGYELAYKMVHHLGYSSLDQLKDKHWAEVVNCLELKLGCWTDPCVEDQIICIIHHANHPNSDKQWFNFTNERKVYREHNGYPKSRPKLAWYENQN